MCGSLILQLDLKNTTLVKRCKYPFFLNDFAFIPQTSHIRLVRTHSYRNRQNTHGKMCLYALSARQIFKSLTRIDIHTTNFLVPTLYFNNIMSGRTVPVWSRFMCFLPFLFVNVALCIYCVLSTQAVCRF